MDATGWRWSEPSGSATGPNAVARRGALVEPLVARLADPMPLPAGADRALGPLGWLLEGAMTGLPLTQKGNLARTVVIESVNRFEWHPLPILPAARATCSSCGHCGNSPATSAQSVAAAAACSPPVPAARSPPIRAALWRAVAGWLGAGQDFHAAVTELALAILLDGQPHAQATLVERVGKAAAGEGWHDRATGQAPDLEAIWGQWYGLLRTLKVLGLVEEDGDWQARTVTLTPVGQATALQALHARAAGPRPDSRG